MQTLQKDRSRRKCIATGDENGKNGSGSGNGNSNELGQRNRRNQPPWSNSKWLKLNTLLLEMR